MKVGDLCPDCKENFMRKLKRRIDGGAFLGCSGFPKCRYCCDIIETEQDHDDAIRELQAVNNDLRRQIVDLKATIEQLRVNPAAEVTVQGEIPF